MTVASESHTGSAGIVFIVIGMTALSLQDWGLCAGLASMTLLTRELSKLARRLVRRTAEGA